MPGGPVMVALAESFDPIGYPPCNDDLGAEVGAGDEDEEPAGDVVDAQGAKAEGADDEGQGDDVAGCESLHGSLPGAVEGVCEGLEGLRLLQGDGLIV